MSSILPQIETLQDVPLFNYKYCEFMLKVLLSKLFEMQEFDIGLFREGEEEGAVIGFDGNDSEDVQLELRYAENRFIIVVTENSTENFACTFQYKIFDDSLLYQMIPDKLRAVMEHAADKSETSTFTLSKK